MNAIPAGDAARSPRVVLDPDQTVKAARTRLEATGVPGAPVVDKRGSLRGSVDLVALVAADQAAKSVIWRSTEPSSRRTTHSTMSLEF